MIESGAATKLFRRWVDEVWSGGTVTADLVAEDFVGHWPGRDIRGPAELAAIIDETRSAFDELTFQIVLGPLTEGGLTAGRWIGRGRNSSGEAQFVGNDILRIADGRIAEYWTGTSRV
ncbi:ester cyclase [Mycolicibacterium tusciae]|uniref:Polyketide cyclase n=1 Tax=Mycolicibacterium tusciae TaxID=75922 RepID=A0A1X0JNK3_9MYCO|nr:nuclear transport factor 2 family protein [Mycolicibacterium tusciae]ORB63946.1 polyketide cyclase [Mycolicibacterium tusciae]